MAHSDSPVAAESSKWYCHTCESETKPSMPEFICSRCQNGFIEPLEETAAESSTSQELRDSSVQTDGSVTSSPSHAPGRVPRRAHITIHHVQQGPLTANPFQDFITQLVSSLMGGSMQQQTPVNIQIAPWLTGPNFGDYVLTAGGLDNVITMLMNQLDGAGPPPARKDQIDALPTVVIVQEQVDASLQCHICMEEFILNEQVRGLPCKHVYHGDCIIPWLELHGTCPMCRQHIDTRPAEQPQSQPQTTSEIPPD